ncbi:PGF-CTERM sorting domain-containing protein [Natronorubrum texcoconense]|uniref:PGF-CTERM protein n=1 Tax=Natronorubrum texcoconense TaxID=1095776 RepID=A0A1G9C787_9EURY|nr:PGF-CTERM sorting domain-containing protein [Natronorubrum texcoconense]SDK47528.1 PGF-CTERM protein [Natronorubrum texcoconense]
MRSVTDGSTVPIGIATVVLLAMTFGGVAAPVAAQEDVDSGSMEVTVSEDGSLERMELSMGMTDETYDEYATWAEMDSYETVEAWYESMFEADESIGDASVTMTELDGGYELSITLDDVDTSEEPFIDIEADDGTVVYEEFDVQDPADDPELSEITYQVNMPGEITDSNAHEIDGNVAVWDLHDEHTDELFVEAALEGGIELDVEENTDADEESADDESESDDGTGTDDAERSAVDDDDGDDSMPGFGSTIALAALCLAALLAVRHRTDAR